MHTVWGIGGSPFTWKLRAALRAKRVPHLFRHAAWAELPAVLSRVRVPVIPVLERKGGAWENDTTPVLLSMEGDRSKGEGSKGEGRSLLPDDPADRLACLIIEDMADEWLSRSMFHHRWAHPVDAAQCAEWLAWDGLTGADARAVAGMATSFRARQEGRRASLGSTPGNAPTHEATFHAVIDALERHARAGGPRFLFGPRASLADVALFGQLRVMADDPTPGATMRERAPLARRWLDHAADAGGCEGAWTPGGEACHALLALAGQAWLPFAAANAVARDERADMVRVAIDGRDYEQPPQAYAARCLAALARAWGEAPRDARDALRGPLGVGAAVLDHAAEGLGGAG